MPIDVKKPARGTRSGRPAGNSQPPKNIYDVPDSNWDMLTPRTDEISPNPFNKREMRKLDELADNIRLNGLDTPVEVMDTAEFVKFWGSRYPEECAKLTTRFVLGPGERRWRASQLAGAETIRAILRNDKIPTIKSGLMGENWHRDNPSIIEQAKMIKELHEDEGLSYSEICELLGIKSRGTITKLLNLLKLPQPVQDAIHRGEISQKAGVILGELDDDDSVRAALDLVTQEGGPSARDAVNRIRSAPLPVSPGNTSADQPQANEPSPDATPDDAPADHETVQAQAAEQPHRGADPQAATESHDTAPKPNASAAAERQPVAAAKSAKSAVDIEAAERATAARARELACIKMLTSDVRPTDKQMADLLRRAFLVGGRVTGRSRAHGWLLTAGKAHFNIKEPEGYFDAVLSSGDDDLIDLAIWAAALADNEVRASDRRRPAWDTHDAMYVQLLIDCGGYEPSTDWERGTLARLGVSLGNTTETDQADQESA